MGFGVRANRVHWCGTGWYGVESSTARLRIFQLPPRKIGEEFEVFSFKPRTRTGNEVSGNLCLREAPERASGADQRAGKWEVLCILPKLSVLVLVKKRSDPTKMRLLIGTEIKRVPSIPVDLVNRFTSNHVIMERFELIDPISMVKKWIEIG